MVFITHFSIISDFYSVVGLPALSVFVINVLFPTSAVMRYSVFDSVTHNTADEAQDTPAKKKNKFTDQHSAFLSGFVKR